jgi:hypothetical protein
MRGDQATDTRTLDENAHAHFPVGAAAVSLEPANGAEVVRIGVDIISRLLAVQAMETQF